MKNGDEVRGLNVGWVVWMGSTRMVYEFIAFNLAMPTALGNECTFTLFRSLPCH
jgi:hypothetical protein